MPPKRIETHFEPLSVADTEAVTALSQAVGWPHRNEDNALLIRLGQGIIARAPGDESPLGVGMWWPFGEDFARLGMIIVRPGLQGQGIGRAIVSRLLDDIGDRSVILLATEAGKPLYENFGFQTTGRILQLQGVYQPVPPTQTARSVSDVPTVEEILEIDRSASGLIRRPILEALLSAGQSDATRDAGGRPTGYAIARDFGRGRVIGPIVAGSEEDAIALFDRSAKPGFLRVDCIAEAPALHHHLMKNGLTPVQADAEIMIRGPWPNPITPPRVFALASHALG